MLWNGATASFDPAYTAGMGSATVTKRGNAAFCFGNLPFTPHNATATIDNLNAANDSLTAYVEIDPPGFTPLTCTPSELVRIETLNASTDSAQAASFWVTFN